MPLITTLSIHSTQSLAGLRNKITFIASELGIPAIRASRLAAACSEASRDFVEKNASLSISLCLSAKKNNQLQVVFSPGNNARQQPSEYSGQRYAPLVDSIQSDGYSLAFCQNLDASIKTDAESCAQLYEKMQRTVIPTRAELEMQAMHDALTHLLNRYALERGFTEEMNRAVRYSFPISVLMMDIDFFKRVNDTYGHHAGDACLVALSSMILSVSRKQDIASRFGGEEFVLVLPHTPPEKALLLAERLRKMVESTPVHYGEETIIFTVSIGMSGFEQATDINSKQLLEMADQALYEAKEAGRNQVCAKLVDT